MVILAYVLSGLSLLMSILFLVKLKEPTLVLAAIFTGIAGALFPYWAIIGAVGAPSGGGIRLTGLFRLGLSAPV